VDAPHLPRQALIDAHGGGGFRYSHVRGRPRLSVGVLRMAGNSGEFGASRLLESAAVHHNPANLLGQMLGQGWTWHDKSID
jgi:hypothetical protein